MPRSLLPRPKPLITVPDILMGNGDSGVGPSTILGRMEDEATALTGAASVVMGEGSEVVR